MLELGANSNILPEKIDKIMEMETIEPLKSSLKNILEEISHIFNQYDYNQAEETSNPSLYFNENIIVSSRSNNINTNINVFDHARNNNGEWTGSLNNVNTNITVFDCVGNNNNESINSVIVWLHKLLN